MLDADIPDLPLISMLCCGNLLMHHSRRGVRDFWQCTVCRHIVTIDDLELAEVPLHIDRDLYRCSRHGELTAILNFVEGTLRYGCVEMISEPPTLQMAEMACDQSCVVVASWPPGLALGGEPFMAVHELLFPTEARIRRRERRARSRSRERRGS